MRSTQYAEDLVEASRAPRLREQVFTCPACGVYTTHNWAHAGFWIEPGDDSDYRVAPFNLERSECFACDAYTIWLAGEMIYPLVAGIEQPNSDLEEDIKADFREAASILHLSPRGASALLRLCLQKLCAQLGGTGKRLDDDIGVLVKTGRLSRKLQRAMDAVRVVGNNAVHPGQLDVRDDGQTAGFLFRLINLVAEELISTPKAIDALYESLPPGQLAAIESRDGRALSERSQSSSEDKEAPR